MDWLWLVLLAVVSLTAGMGGMAWAQRHVSVAVSSVLSLGATVITAVGAWVFFDQPLEVLQIVGGLVVLVSLAGSSSRNLRRRGRCRACRRLTYRRLSARRRPAGRRGWGRAAPGWSSLIYDPLRWRKCLPSVSVWPW